MKAVSLIAILVFAGCGKKAAEAPATPNAASTVVEGATNSDEDNIAKQTQRLTQVLRKFAAENRRVPRSLDELVQMGYLPELPVPPGGKKFVFDDQLRVTLKDAK